MSPHEISTIVPRSQIENAVYRLNDIGYYVYKSHLMPDDMITLIACRALNPKKTTS